VFRERDGIRRLKRVLVGGEWKWHHKVLAAKEVHIEIGYPDMKHKTGGEIEGNFGRRPTVEQYRKVGR